MTFFQLVRREMEGSLPRLAFMSGLVGTSNAAILAAVNAGAQAAGSGSVSLWSAGLFVVALLLFIKTQHYILIATTVEIEAITYIRGRSIPNQFIIIDEAQNLTPHEIKTIVSRVGQGTKIVLTGDPEQIDNPYLDSNSNGLTYTAERMKGQLIAAHIFLSKSERSELASIAANVL